MNAIEKLNQRWRTMLLKRLVITAVLIFAAECFIFLFSRKTGLLSLPFPQYIMRFLILPTIINVIASVGGYIANDVERIPDNTKNLGVCLSYFIVCACVQCTHYIFSPVLCAPILAIFISSVFGDTKITTTIAVSGTLTLVASTLIAASELRADDPQLFIDAVIAGLIIVCSYLTSEIIIKKQNEQGFALEDSINAREALSNQLCHDVLTKLYNRKSLFNLLESNYAAHIPTSLAIIDIDNFKRVNDTYGHSKGDEVLLYLSELMRKMANEKIFVSRFGGEEFAIVFSDVTPAEIRRSLGQLHVTFAAHPFTFGGKAEKHITFSCGVVTYNDTMNVNTFFNAADEAMYSSKTSGKNKITYLL